MRGALIPAALSSLLLSLPADAGVAVSGAVSSCPAVIKNVITMEMLLSDDFAPWDVVGAVDTVDTVNAVIAIDTVDTVVGVDTIAAVNAGNAIDTVIAVDTINTANAVGKINAADTINQERRARRGKIKFGRRAAFNHSQVSNLLVRIYSHDGDGFSYAGYGNRVGFGLGFEVAGIVGVRLSEALSLEILPGVVFQKPINTAVVGTSEVGVLVPVLFEWGPFGVVSSGGGGSAGGSSDVFARAGRFDPRQLRLFGGVWVGAPVYARVKWNGEGSAPFRERAPVDFGLACGVGVYVSDKAFVDVRGNFGLSGYDGAVGHRLNQLAIGVNYVK